MVACLLGASAVFPLSHPLDIPVVFAEVSSTIPGKTADANADLPVFHLHDSHSYQWQFISTITVITLFHHTMASAFNVSTYCGCRLTAVCSNLKALTLCPSLDGLLNQKPCCQQRGNGEVQRLHRRTAVVSPHNKILVMNRRSTAGINLHSLEPAHSLASMRLHNRNAYVCGKARCVCVSVCVCGEDSHEPPGKTMTRSTRKI